MRDADRLARLPRFMNLDARRRAREALARGADVISLDVGDPDLPPPPHVVHALRAAAADHTNYGYPTDGVRGTRQFRDAVSAWYARRFGVSVDPRTEVLALIGAKEGCHHVALAVCNPGDVALVPDPAYPAYEASAVFAGAEVVRLPLRRQHGYLVDFAAIPQRVARRAALMWVSYPNNPTTAVAPLEFYQRAVEFCHEHQILLVSDNPYSELALDGVRLPSVLEVDGAKEVAVEFISLSKTYNLAGCRIGMAVGNAAAIAGMATVKGSTDAGVFQVVQAAGTAALEGPQDIVERNVAEYRRRRDIVIDSLRQIGVDVSPPGAGIYVWTPVPPGLTSVGFANHLFDATGVVVTPGIGYGSLGEGYIRLSLAGPGPRLDEAMRRLTACWSGIVDDQPLGRQRSSHSNGVCGVLSP